MIQTPNSQQRSNSLEKLNMLENYFWISTEIQQQPQHCPWPIKHLTRSVPFCTGGRPWTCNLVLITSKGHTNVAAIAPIMISQCQNNQFLKTHENEEDTKKDKILRETH
jgi:hypothetical protein